MLVVVVVGHLCLQQTEVFFLLGSVQPEALLLCISPPTAAKPSSDAARSALSFAAFGLVSLGLHSVELRLSLRPLCMHVELVRTMIVSRASFSF